MLRTRFYVVLALVGTIGLTSEVSYGALAAAAGGSGASGTLSKNKAIRKQQLICDPDEPVSGSLSVSYNPAVVTLSALIFGPGYGGSGSIEIDNGEGTQMVSLGSWLAEPFGTQTGYVQVSFSEPIITIDNAPAAAAPSTHGQITPPTGYLTIDNDGPVAVDTHAFFFDYLPNVPDATIATYTIFADSGNRSSGNQADFLSGFNEQGAYTIPFNQIASATVSGSLDAVPVPPAALIGGITMLGMAVAGKIRRRRQIAA